MAGLCGAASAVMLTISPALAEDPGQLMVGAGVFGLDSDHDHLFQADANYRFGWGFFGGDGAFRGLKPIIGGMVNADGGFMGYAGLAAPFQFDNGRWEIQPWAAMGGSSRRRHRPGWDFPVSSRLRYLIRREQQRAYRRGLDPYLQRQHP
jgi:hypothetical protein